MRKAAVGAGARDGPCSVTANVPDAARRAAGAAAVIALPLGAEIRMVSP
jgi:hypothetical protein